MAARSLSQGTQIMRHRGLTALIGIGAGRSLGPIYWQLSYAMTYVGLTAERVLTPIDTRRRLQQMREGAGPPKATGIDRLKVSDLGIPIDRLSDSSECTVLADIDQDGFFTSHVGPMTGIPTVSSSEHQPRERFDVQLVAWRGGLAVRKSFRGDAASFVREVEALAALGAARCNVPALLDYDAEALTVLQEFVPGQSLRDALADRGAPIRDRDVASGTPKAKRISDGRKYLHEVMPPARVDELAEQLRRSHAAGFILHDLKYGNVILHSMTQMPVLIDFDRASTHRRLPAGMRRVLRERDNVRLNALIGSDLPTRGGITTDSRLSHPYAPFSLPGGVHVGRVTSVDVGPGRWRFILRENLPALEGRRVLDLGANNAFNALQMLRSGAREVVAIELDSAAIEQGIRLRELYEWADGRRYDLRYIHDTMASPSIESLGHFDLVTALCSIYYLDEPEIGRVLRQLRRQTDTVALQCNVDTGLRRSEAETLYKASVGFAESALRAAGFNVITTLAPRGYSRPLVIGVAQGSSGRA
jgi:serine/threonine protein kinase